MTLRIRSDVTMTDVDDGMVLLDEGSGRYFQLNRSGAALLRLLLAGRSTDEAAAELTRAQPDNAERARTDAARLVESLVKVRLAVLS
jgi:hypothetical protein